MANDKYQYHIVLRTIYENFGINWFTFRNFLDSKADIFQQELYIRSKMNYMLQYKAFLDKKTWNHLNAYCSDFNKTDKRSKYWKIKNRGLLELSLVFKDLKIRDEHISILAKMLLEDNA